MCYLLFSNTLEQVGVLFALTSPQYPWLGGFDDVDEQQKSHAKMLETILS